MTYPIILAHGICRFDTLLDGGLVMDNQGDDSRHYFKHIRSTLRAAGFVAFHSNVRWAGSADERAADLKPQIEQVLRDTQAPKVNIIAHSMGGLDARHLLFNYRAEKIHEKIASITTIGTPHHGTSFADWGVKNLGEVQKLLVALGIDLKGFSDLTTTACHTFNDAARQFEATCGVRFRTYAGAQPLARTFLPLKGSYEHIKREEGDNDGLVPVPSAMWEQRYFVAPVLNADHLNQIGWWDTDERFLLLFGESQTHLEQRIQQLYLQIARDLP